MASDRDRYREAGDVSVSGSADWLRDFKRGGVNGDVSVGVASAVTTGALVSGSVS